jgi:hypothetical protein
MTRLGMGKSVHRWEVVNPTAVRLRIFTPFLFWFVYDTSAVRRPTLTIGSLWKGTLLDFRLVKSFFENIKAFRSYHQFKHDDLKKWKQVRSPPCSII